MGFMLQKCVILSMCSVYVISSTEISKDLTISSNETSYIAHNNETNNINGTSSSDLNTIPSVQEILIKPNRGFWDWILGNPGVRPPEGGSGTPALSYPKNCPSCDCGQIYKHQRIVGGIVTHVNRYPWMVLLMYNTKFYCAASLINSRYLLTAAHCVTGFAKEKLSALFLEHDRNDMYETQTFSRRITKILKHKSYGSGHAYNNDIALLQIDQEVKFTDLVKPVCLPTTGKSFTGFKGIVTGWGAIAEYGAISPSLREVEVPIMSNKDCRKSGYGGKITDNMLCAGYKTGGKDACQGDSGGPLHIVNATKYAQAGIVSWGEGCAQGHYPGVYTRVNRFVTWIKSNSRDACYCT